MQHNKVNLDELLEVHGQLAEIKGKLQASNKPDFIIADICHTIRSPVTGIINMLEEMRTDPKQLTQKNVETVKKAAQELFLMVDEALDSIQEAEPQRRKRNK